MQEISFRDDVLPLKDKLFRLAFRITLNKAEAEDVVQDTLIRVWSKRNEWADIESVEAYCMTVARNLSIDRSEKLETKNMAFTPEMAESIGGGGEPDAQLVGKEKLELLDRLINGLPEKQRLILQLREMEGESYKKIAALLGITEEQVKVNLFRARQKIKQNYLKIDGYGL